MTFPYLLELINPHFILGVNMTPIDFFEVNKHGSLDLRCIKFCDFFYIIYLSHKKTQKKTGLDSVVLKVCKKKVTLIAFWGQYDPN